MSINDRIQSNKDSIGILPKIQNEKTRNIEYQDSAPTNNNKYRYQSESSVSVINNYKKSSMLLKNHAY